MSIRTKLILAFSIVALVPLFGGAIGIFSYRSARRDAELARLAARQANEAVSAVHSLQGAVAGLSREGVAGKGTAAAREHLIRLQSVAAGLSLRPETLTSVDSSLRTLESSSATPAAVAAASGAVQVLLSEVNGRTAAALGARESTTGRAGDLLELLMGVGTLFGIALGIGFGVVTSVAVTRHVQGIAHLMWGQTTEVAAAAGEVVEVSGSLAQASSQQAASLEEAGASLTEVNRIVKTNADHAREAQGISQENRKASDRSAGEVAELQTAMQEMASANRNIAAIIKSIDEIAFQTNILALNAAVEAARAGEAGLGFAVVAEEVRSLAQRAAQAARETTTKIDDALAKSTRGAAIAGRVEQSLRAVIADSHRIDEVVARIAGASAEQARSLDQAVHGMDRIDQLTQSNTASAGQTADAARQLDTKIGELRQQLSQLLDQRAEQAPDRAASAPGPVSPPPAPRGPLSPPGRRSRGAARNGQLLRAAAR